MLKKRLRKKKEEMHVTIPFARFSFLRLGKHFLMRLFDEVGIFVIQISTKIFYSKQWICVFPSTRKSDLMHQILSLSLMKIQIDDSNNKIKIT